MGILARKKHLPNTFKVITISTVVEGMRDFIYCTLLGTLRRSGGRYPGSPPSSATLTHLICHNSLNFSLNGLKNGNSFNHLKLGLFHIVGISAAVDLERMIFF